jgi:hypothetical protein
MDAWQFESVVSNELTIELAESVPDTAEITLQIADDTAPHGWRFPSITLADLRAYLEQRDAAYVAASTASRLGQSAQVEEVK